MNTFHKDVHKLCEIVDCIESKQENKLNVDTLKTLRDSYKKLEPLFKVILENKLMDFLTEQFTTEEINKISKAAYLSYAYDAVMQNEPAKCGAYLIQYYNLRGTKANSSMN
jgi:Na+-transporting NADH:ubiquinone oxidoreductase subunit NqrC